MPIFFNTQLSINVNQANQTAFVSVTGTVILDPSDTGSFSLGCTIVGDDPVFDDPRFQYTPTAVIGQGFTQGVSFDFSSSEPLKNLNEDLIGKDEIYAQLVLRKNNELGQ